MIENYEEKTVDETLEAVADFDRSELREFVQFERENKARVGVVRPLEQRLESVGESESDTDDSDPDTVTVEHPRGTGYAAGHWFDIGETKTVERTTRIEQAIEADELEVID